MKIVLFQWRQNALSAAMRQPSVFKPVQNGSTYSYQSEKNIPS